MPGRPPVKSFDVVVLGGGVIGLACAREIRARHPEWRIAVLDAPTGSIPASKAAAGMLAPFAEFAEDTALARFCVSSLGMYTRFVADLQRSTGMPVDLSWKGTLIPEEPENRGRFQRKKENLSARGVPLRTLEGFELRAAEPRLSPGVARALWLPEGMVNPRQLHDALAAEATGHGVVLLEGRAVTCLSSGDRLAGFELEDGTRLRGEFFVAAAGAWSSELAGVLDVAIPITPIKGQMIRVGAPEGFVRHVVHLPHIYAAPREGFGVIVGSTMENKGFDTLVEEKIVRWLMGQAEEILPGLAEFPVVERWAGLRPHTPDGYPVLGWLKRWSNLLVATGHFRNGILLTPITARVVATLLDEPERADWQEFAPGRLGL